MSEDIKAKIERMGFTTFRMLTVDQHGRTRVRIVCAENQWMAAVGLVLLGLESEPRETLKILDVVEIETPEDVTDADEYSFDMTGRRIAEDEEEGLDQLPDPSDAFN